MFSLLNNKQAALELGYKLGTNLNTNEVHLVTQAEGDRAKALCNSRYKVIADNTVVNYANYFGCIKCNTRLSKHAETLGLDYVGKMEVQV